MGRRDARVEGAGEAMILNEGEKFNGCRVESSKDVDTGHVWIFSRGNTAVVMSLPADQYFDLIVKPYERERVLDYMAECIDISFREKEKRINSLQSGGKV